MKANECQVHIEAKEARRSKKRAILVSLKWGGGWSRCSIYFVHDCSLLQLVHKISYGPASRIKYCIVLLYCGDKLI